ncbi:hypothetical protein [Iodidimonas nitroreducens]|jgi:hypothetical protein|nr:hypothetical protein [Iodidimonas nitroreducens]
MIGLIAMAGWFETLIEANAMADYIAIIAFFTRSAARYEIAILAGFIF